MKKKIVTFIIGFCFYNVITSQVKENDSILESKIESFIITMQSDSALSYLPKISNSSYKDLLLRIVNSDSKKISYKDYKTFLTKITNKGDINYNTISDYINDFIKIPVSNDKINLDYTAIKYKQISTLRNNGNLDEASKQNIALDTYINLFNKGDESFKIQKAYVNIHDAIMNYIQRDYKEGRRLLDNSLKTARSYKDVPLEIASLYYLSDFLVVERKLDEFIDISEKSLLLEEKLSEKTSYYTGTIEHLVNAYAFKGGYDKRVEELLEELYNNPVSKKNSYSLYAQYLSTLDVNSDSKKNIFKKFKANDASEFTDIIVKESKGKLNDNDFYFVLSESSKLLENDDFLEKALRYKEQAVVLTRKIYSEDLTESLANFKTQQAIKSKEMEVSIAKERSRLYVLIASLTGILLTISLIVLVKFRKQSKVLKSQNLEIENNLKEKELLIKEVHHRVKNNFQIVSSLLELQSKEIEDEKALELTIEGKNRVKSMALIHQKLYQKESGLIDFGEYIHLLIKEISVLYKSSVVIDTKIDINNLFFDIDTAIPLGLIVNELITNAYKYAFVNQNKGKLNISIDKVSNTNYKLRVSDNGLGFDESFNIKKAKSLGLRLVNRLVKQLQGNLDLFNNEGANFEILFQDTKTRKLVS